MKKRANPRSAFTLVELLVVIAIIALLLAALLPAFGVVKKNARIAETQSIFTGLSTGIESYRAEQTLGASLPPSTGDNTTGDRRLVAMPSGTDTTPVKVAGANLLVLALVGDGLGTAGFKNVQGTPGWWDDTHKDFTAKGLYAVDPATGKEAHTRYGPYADDKLSTRVKRLDELVQKGKIVGPGAVSDLDFVKAKLPVFVDSWETPILYYKASSGSTKMLGDATSPGIYRHADNNILTGSDAPVEAGLDFGSGVNSAYGGYHAIAKTKSPEANAIVDQIITDQTDYPNTFALFILDKKVKSRPTPVQKDSYLLISAGPDSIYGTADDVTNWTRDSE